MRRSRNPFDEIEQFFERMSGQFEGGDWPAMGTRSVAVDVADRGEEFVVTADLPGYDQEDIDLTLSDNTLQIGATREETTGTEEEDETHQYIQRERRRRAVSRSIRLPEAVDEEETTASYSNGVLTVTLPKRALDDEGRRIDID